MTIHADDRGGPLTNTVRCVNIAALYYESTFQTSPIKIFLDLENQNKGLLLKPFEAKILRLATARPTRKRPVHSLLSTTLMQRKLSLFSNIQIWPSLLYINKEDFISYLLSEERDYLERFELKRAY